MSGPGALVPNHITINDQKKKIAELNLITTKPAPLVLPGRVALYAFFMCNPT